jgi:hypothetical protein
MKKALVIVALLTLLAASAFPDPQVSQTISLTTGVAVRVAVSDVQFSSLFIQMKHGGANLGYVLFADPAITCNVTTPGQLVAELAPATSTAPGGSFIFPTNGTANFASGGTNAHFWCVQGTTGDSVIVSYNQRN